MDSLSLKSDRIDTKIEKMAPKEDLSEIQKNMDVADITFNSFTMGPRSPYNLNLKDNNLGLYVNIIKRFKSNL